LAASLLIILAIFAAFALQVIWGNAARREKIDAQFAPIGQFITVNGARVHYKTSGHGPDIVLIHGASGNLREWEFGLRAALETRFTVTAFDRAGHGHSDAIAGGNTLAAQAAHLRAACAALGIRTPVLLGHSYGGSVALAWALQEKPPALLLISAPSLPWPGRLDPWYRVTNSRLGRSIVAPIAAALVPAAYVRRATNTVFAPQTAPPEYLQNFGAMLATRAHSLAANTAQVNALLGDIRSQMARYPALDTPCEMIHGDADTIVPLAIHSQKLAHILPRARLTVLQGAGHMPHHAHLDTVLAALSRLLP
jgi:pimeloyl-ACP methyl ester carboxylesterase